MTTEEAIADLKEALKEVDMFRKIYLKQRKVSVECEKRYASLSFAIKSLESWDKLDTIIIEQLDKTTDQKECMTLRWVLDKMAEVRG